MSFNDVRGGATAHIDASTATAKTGDIVIAADTARFCQLESKRGIAPLGGAHFRYLTRTGWGNAMYHLFLCDEFGAEEALRIGIVARVFPDESFRADTEAVRARARPADTRGW